MLPGLRSDLLARLSALSSAAVRPSKFPLTSFCHLPLRLSCPHVPREPAFPPFSYLLFPPACPLSRPVAARVVPSFPVPLGPAPSVAVVCDKRDSKGEKKERGK